jgi:type II secretory pathway component GspD/PulD (secretin)
MRAIHAVILVALAIFCSPGPARSLSLQQKMQLTFSQTDVAQVLKAISLRTGANIVYAGGKESIPITLNVNADTAEEAIRAATSAAGLAFRRTGRTYVVAKPEALKAALEPFAMRVRFSPGTGDPIEITKILEEALPHATVKLIANRIHVTAVPEDVSAARDFIRDYEERQQRSKTTTVVVNVKNAAPDKITPLLSSLYPKVKFVPAPSGATGGAIGITGPEEDVAAARATIEEIDLQNVGRGLDYRVYQVKYSTGPILKEMLEAAVPDVKVTIGPEHYSPPQPVFRPLSGATLGGTGGGGGAVTTGTGTGSGSTSSGGGTVQPFQKATDGDRAKALLISGPSEQLDTAFRVLEQMDVRPQQVSVEVRVVDTSPESNTDLGFNFNWTRLGFFEAPPGTHIIKGPGTEFNDFNTRPAGFGTFSRVPWNVDAFLRALTTRKEAKILANPSISVVDNDDANIFIGDTIRTRVSTASGLGGTTVQIVEFPIGIILLLRPRVNADGNITMRVHPVVSTITSLDSQGIPQTSSREAETTVMVKDGETVVIGGLMRDEYTKTVREIPILSRIPIIGELFKDRSTSRRKSDILVFITPRIIKDGDTAAPPREIKDKDGGGR